MTQARSKMMEEMRKSMVTLYLHAQEAVVYSDKYGDGVTGSYVITQINQLSNDLLKWVEEVYAKRAGI